MIRAAGAMGAATFMSRILGLVREQVIAALFGAGWTTDAYVIAFRIPNLLRDLFAEGAMSSALVPTFTQVRATEGDVRAWQVAGRVFRFLFVLVCIVSILGTIFAPQLVHLLAHKFDEDPSKFALTVLLTRVLFPFFPLVALAAAYMGVLNACGKFFVPAFASALFNLTSIVTGVALAKILPHWGIEPIIGLCIGVVLGGAVQAFCQLPSLYQVGYRWPGNLAGSPSWRTDPALKRMLTLMVPGLIGLSATQVSLVVNSTLATSQGTGAVSWLSYAFRLLQFPIGIFGVSLAAACLPRVAKAWVLQDYREVASTITDGLKQVFAINLPASAGLGFLGVPIIALLFQHGRFTEADTRATAMALAAYSIGIVFYSSAKVLVPACYAMGNARTPVISSFVSVGVTLALNLILVSRLGFWSLALGTSVGAGLNSIQLLFAVRRILAAKGQSLPLRPIVNAFLIYSVVALLMGIAVFGLDQGLIGFGIKSRWLRVGLGVGVGGGLVMTLGWLFKLQELNQALRFFLNRFKKKLSPQKN